jgi:UDP-2,4-diacetamido-2,4,6-trideoxy-beta-L-altropyranose hydrolase
MSLGTILIRADASAAIGAGHVMRCLALGQAWQDAGGKVVFAMADSTPAILARLAAENCAVTSICAAAGSLEDAECLSRLASEISASWIVLDGYSFSSNYCRRMKETSAKQLFVADNDTEDEFVSDLILNHNLHAKQTMFRRRSSGSVLLLGPRFALLRREFNAWRGWHRQTPPTVRKILVTMGGSDPAGLSEFAIQALQRVRPNGLEIILVVGGSNPHIEDLRNRTRKFKGNLRVETDVTNIPELMAWADLAISAAGSTYLEMCMLGLPSIVIDGADNQLPIAHELHGRGGAVHVARGAAIVEELALQLETLVNSAQLRAHLSERAAALVDGRGAARVVAAMRGRAITFRLVQEKDRRLIWEWANDPSVRHASFSSSTIHWPEHCQWFAQKLNDPRCTMLLFEESGIPIGTVRIEQTTRMDAQISVTISPQHRGFGLARHLLATAVNTAFRSEIVRRIHAFTKPENTYSINSFEAAGFKCTGTTELQGIRALHYVHERDQHSGEFASSAELEIAECK